MMKHKVMGKIIMVFALLLIGGYASGQNYRGNSLWSHTTITADTSYIPTENEKTGDAYYDSENRTVSVALGNGVVMQINQETLIQVHNGSGATIMNGRILGAIGGANDRVSVTYADKANRYDALIISTEIIQADSIGLACEIAGRVNGVNTGIVPVGPIYLDTLGLITADPGEFPDYNYTLGSVVKTGVTDGIIQFRSDGANFRNDVRNAFDGAIRETFDFRTFSDGINVYGVLTNQDAPDSTLTLMFSDDWHDFIIPDTITLTPGTATNPQQSWVYIDKETRTLQSSTSGFPSTEHAEIAKITLLSAVRTQADGALRNQNTNNHLKYANNNGHIVHMGDRIRVLNAQWEDGVALTVSGTPTNLYLSTTSGHVWQMHKQAFEAHDMAAGDDIHIVNDFTTPYTTTTNLNTVTTYSDGSTWNNEWQNLVLWGVGNKTGEVSHIMLNLSSDGYLTEDDAIEDANNYASYTIPRAFRGVGFLIARITVRRSPTGYTYNPSTGYLDLRGYYPNNTAGGGTGSSGLTEFTQLDDTPSLYIGFGDSALFVTSAEDGVEFRQIQQSDVKDLVSDISALQAESHPAVTLAGTPDYITINPTTQEITRSQIDLTSDVTGVLPDGNISSASTWNNIDLDYALLNGNIGSIGATFMDNVQISGSPVGTKVFRVQTDNASGAIPGFYLGWDGSVDIGKIDLSFNNRNTDGMRLGTFANYPVSIYQNSSRMVTIDDGNLTINGGLYSDSIISSNFMGVGLTPSFIDPYKMIYINYNGDGFPVLSINRTGGITKTDAEYEWYIGSTGSLVQIKDGVIIYNYDGAHNFIGNATFTGNVTIPADPYDATWGELQEAAPKDAVYDKIESLSTGSVIEVERSFTSFTGTQAYNLGADNKDAIYEVTWHVSSGGAIYDFGKFILYGHYDGSSTVVQKTDIIPPSSGTINSAGYSSTNYNVGITTTSALTGELYMGIETLFDN